MPKNLILDLRMRLTNNECRGDYKDDGHGAGSLFKELIDDYNMGVISGQDWWAITAWPDSRFRGPVAWCLLRPEPRYLPTLRVGTYTAPEWRRRGIGKLLMNECVRLAQRQGYERVIASPWNVQSLSFFSSAGFGIVTRHGGGMSGLAEVDVPREPVARLPWRCRPPEV
jgi:GNAT superfamily N-acetyltransferase